MSEVSRKSASGTPAGLADEVCGCRSRNECCAPGFPGCRRDELPWSLERDLRLVEGNCERDCREQCQGACGVDHLTKDEDL